MPLPSLTTLELSALSLPPCCPNSPLNWVRERRDAMRKAEVTITLSRAVHRSLMKSLGRTLLCVIFVQSHFQENQPKSNLLDFSQFLCLTGPGRSVPHSPTELYHPSALQQPRCGIPLLMELRPEILKELPCESQRIWEHGFINSTELGDWPPPGSRHPGYVRGEHRQRVSPRHLFLKGAVSSCFQFLLGMHLLPFPVADPVLLHQTSPLPATGPLHMPLPPLPVFP